MLIKRVNFIWIFFLLCISNANAGTNENDPYSQEIDRLEQLEKDFQALIKEAKEIISDHSSTKEKKPSPEPEPQMVTEMPEPPSHEEILSPVPEPVIAVKEIEIDEPVEQSYQIYHEPDQEMVPYDFMPETPWADSFYEQAPEPYAYPVREEENTCSSSSYARRSNPCCRGDSILLYGDFYFGDRPGYNGNIYTGGLMYFESSLWRNGAMIFLDVNGSYFESANCGVTAGIGARFDVPCSNTILGINAYIDYVDSDIRSFRQASVGLEWINCAYSLRANAYFPVGKERTTPTHTIWDDYIGDYIVEVDSWINALQGYDIEYRHHICLPCNFWMYPAIGAYYLSGDNCSKLGVMGGLEVSWRNIFSVEGIAYYDQCNRGNAEVRLSITIPIESLCNPCLGPCCPDYSRGRVRRRNYIPTERVCCYTTNYL